MSQASTVPAAETAPTERRAGADIDPHRVECWACRRSGVTENTVNLCRCGRWFEVLTGGDDA